MWFHLKTQICLGERDRRPRDNLGLLPRHLGVNLDTVDTSVLIHPARGKIKNLEEIYMKGGRKETSIDITGRKYSSVNLGTRRKTTSYVIVLL